MTTVKSQPTVTRDGIRIDRDTSRVIARFFAPEDAERVARLIDKALGLSPEQAERVHEGLRRDYFPRHTNLSGMLLRHYDEASRIVPIAAALTDRQKLLIGAYVTMEYSFESAALFNPSMMLHPDQTGLPAGSMRFVMSLRATGEGHISSIVFREGTIDARGAIRLVAHRTFADLPVVERDASGSDADYTIRFRPEQAISERVIFPVLKNESKGMEDARFVRFADGGDAAVYYATYTAYDGFSITPQLIETRDYLEFRITMLGGRAVRDKGMALFPRKVGGKYAMLSRQDGENNRIMFSDTLYAWDESVLLEEPARPWQFMRIGNCGSPLETSKGWLVLTHGVGPMRQYSIGALLLDLEDPRKVIAHLEEPLLVPNAAEREGYVPNVVYSCGSIIHNNRLVLPYAMSDISSGIATVDVDELIGCMQPVAH